MEVWRGDLSVVDRLDWQESTNSVFRERSVEEMGSYQVLELCKQRCFSRR